MHPFRTRFAKNIVAEFLPALSLSKGRRHRKTKVVIFCSGMPSVPSKLSVLEFFAKRGYWVFFPRYRGSWESGGQFLKKSPEKDILDVINGLPKGFTSFVDGKRYRVKPDSLYLIGSSFGGPAALLLSRDPRVTKVIALSSVVDWTAPSKAEPMDWLYTFVRDAFGEGYRFSKKDWDKLKNGKFYNPAGNLQKIDGRKVFVVHAKDDDVVKFGAVKKLTEKIGAQSLFLARGGHLGSRVLTRPAVYRRIAKFLRDK